jgi:hypothetical protein
MAPVCKKENLALAGDIGDAMVDEELSHFRC